MSTNLPPGSDSYPPDDHHPEDDEEQPDFLTVQQIDQMISSIETRQARFDEPLGMSIGVVLMNFGDRFARVEAIDGSWSGFKYELPPTDGIPKSPTGSVCVQGPGKKLAWVDEPR